jgi:hypothetical protein
MAFTILSDKSRTLGCRKMKFFQHNENGITSEIAKHPQDAGILEQFNLLAR